MPAGLAGLTFVGAALSGRPPWELSETFYLAAVFGGLTAFLASSLVLGTAVIATESGPRPVGALLVVAALVFLVPLSVEAFGWDAPGWLPAVILGIWAVAYVGAGFVWRDAVGPDGDRRDAGVGAR